MLASEPSEDAIRRFLNEKYPGFVQLEMFMERIKKFGQATSAPNVESGDVYLMKLLCETIFRDIIVPDIHRNKKASDREPSSSVVGAEV